MPRMPAGAGGGGWRGEKGGIQGSNGPFPRVCQFDFQGLPLFMGLQNEGGG